MITYSGYLVAINIIYTFYIVYDHLISRQTLYRHRIPVPKPDPVILGIALVQLYSAWGVFLERAVLARPNLLHPVPFYAGLILIVTRIWGKRYTHSFLGKNYTSYVIVGSHSTLTTDGPYRFLRHPMYTLRFLGCIAIPLIYNAWATLGIIVVGDILTMSFRIRQEERSLIRHFGQAYRDYMATTNAVIPIKYATGKLRGFFRSVNLREPSDS